MVLVRTLDILLRTACRGALASCAATASPAQRPPREPPGASKLDLYLGGRSFDHDDWHPVEDQGMIGLEFVHEGRDAPVGFEVAVFASEDDEHVVHIPTGIARARDARSGASSPR
jgi:hypothetical protein